MNIRHLILLFFILAIPISLYFTLTKHPVQPTSIAIPTKSPEIHRPIETRANNNTLAIQPGMTENGTQSYFVATKAIPIVDIEVIFDAGSSRDGAKPGLSQLCVHTLDEGVPGLSADEIATRFENAGAQYYTHVDRDKIKIALRSLTDPKLLEPVVELFSMVIASPAFPEANINIIKNQTLVELKHQLQKPNILASNAFYKAIYQEHPYAHPIPGTLDSVASITKADLMKFHQQFFVANNAIITVVGGISKEYADDLANRIAKKLPTGNKAAPLPEVPPTTTADTQQISFDAEQAHILMGEPCATEGDPDYFPLIVGNYILGGKPLNSRLFKEIRDNRGLAYHVGSALILLKRPGPLAIKLQTKLEQTEEAIGLLKENLFRFIKEGPTHEEVLEAKQGIIQALPLETNTNAKIKDFVSNIAFYKLPLDFLNTYSKQVDSVTTENIKAVFQHRVHPEKMALIVVGTRSH